MGKVFKFLLALLFIPCLVVVGVGDVSQSPSYFETGDGPEVVNSTDVALGLTDDERVTHLFVSTGYGESNKLFVWNDENGTFVRKSSDYDGAFDFGNGKSSGASIKDINGDGILDIVVVNELDDAAIQIWVGEDDESFSNSTVNWEFAAARKVVVEDFDGVNGADIFVCDTGQSRILYNDGDDNFIAEGENHVLIGGVNSGCADAAVGDFDGDGYYDIVMASQNMDSSAVFLNTGTALGATPSYIFNGIGNLPPLALAVGDINKDGMDDVVFACPDKGSVWMAADPAGEFQFEKQADVGNANAVDVVLDDADGDGYPDLYFANFGEDALFLNDSGAGSFRKAETRFPDEKSVAVAAADLGEGNDVLDFVVVLDGKSRIWMGRDRSRRIPSEAPTLNEDFAAVENATAFGNLQSYSLDAGDIDRDSNIDIFVANNGTNTVYLGLGNGTFEPVNGTISGAGDGFTRDVDLFDVNNDGWLDAVIVEAGRNGAVLVNNKNGKFNATIPLGNNSSDCVGVATGYFTDDNYLDVVVINEGGDDVLFVNVNGTSFDNGNVILAGKNSNAVAVADVDGHSDKSDDIIISNGAGSDGITLFVNSGNGNFVTDVLDVNATDVSHIGVEDLNGDGKKDLFIVKDGAPNEVWFNNSSEGGGVLFVDSGQRLGENNSTGVALVDTDGDGDRDAVVSNRGGQASRIWINEQKIVDGEEISGYFFESTEIMESINSMGITSGDFDRDGDSDFFIINASPNQVWINNTPPAPSAGGGGGGGGGGC